MTSTPPAPLRERLAPRVTQHFPGFERHRELSARLGDRTRVYAFRDEDCRDWYRRFAADVLRAVDEHRYLPVYRMADGEFSFALGPPEEFLPWRRLGPRRALKRVLATVTGRRGRHASGSPNYRVNETYSRDERQSLLRRYAADLAFIARHGYLALGLDDSPFFAPFHPFIENWLDGAGVHLHAGNYVHFYAVYALLNGPDGDRLLRGRRVLVVNHLPPERRAVLDAALRARGAADVRFLPISRDKAMLETLDPGAVDGPVDLALVGAGVGAANVLRQLEPLGAPCIDAGFALDLMAQPEMRWDRPYCVPDGEFDPERIRFLPADALRRLRSGA
ncbi:hypothetical protein [Longimicrobium sp.]|uniref:hypothetical protein n=1 Tax=Longimicrobium sp. TaxID=2029185 RepID=UPI002E30B5B6|nr:hypothetical protein [Longimicrobium sp.]HEX6037527.1 hypothetical protein [Longimicrobium sp.]